MQLIRDFFAFVLTFPLTGHEKLEYSYVSCLTLASHCLVVRGTERQCSTQTLLMFG
jgi:hypothetical protein